MFSEERIEAANTPSCASRGSRQKKKKHHQGTGQEGINAFKPPKSQTAQLLIAVVSLK